MQGNLPKKQVVLNDDDCKANFRNCKVHFDDELLLLCNAFQKPQ